MAITFASFKENYCANWKICANPQWQMRKANMLTRKTSNVLDSNTTGLRYSQHKERPKAMKGVSFLYMTSQLIASE